MMPAAPGDEGGNTPCSNSAVAPARTSRLEERREGRRPRGPRNARCRPGRRPDTRCGRPRGLRPRQCRARPVPLSLLDRDPSRVHGARQRRRQPLRRRHRPVQHGLPGTRRHVGEQLQRQQQHPGHRHDHRGGGPVRTGEPVRPDQPEPARLSGWRGAHDCAQRAQRRLRRRRQPAGHRAGNRHPRGRVPHRPQQRRRAGRDVGRSRHQRTLGHDLGAAVRIVRTSCS